METLKTIKQKTKLEIIEETAAFYGQDPSRRSVAFSSESGEAIGCLYVSNNGNKCAFSRCCTDEGVKILSLSNTASIRGICAIKSSSELVDLVKMNSFLKEEYKGHDIKFWMNIQRIHDDPSNFDINCLSPKGMRFIEELKEQYKN